MKLRVISIGKFSLKALSPLCADYTHRIKKYSNFEWIVVKSAAEISRKINSGDYTVVLDERGEEWSSKELADWFAKQQLHAMPQITFCVGPAEGWPEEIRKRANKILSLSRMTLQHEQSLLILLEQIYRAFTILKGEPYHK